MPELFTERTVGTIQLPKNSNLINYSVLNEFYSSNPYRSFSIKYVVEGSELYAVNGTKYEVKDQEYLLANNLSEGFVEVDSKKAVTGICIDIAPSILSEVTATLLCPSSGTADLSLNTFFNTSGFLEQKYNARSTRLGQVLLKLQRELSVKPEEGTGLSKEFYYLLSEQIVADHVPIVKQLQDIKAVKTETRKVLLRSVMKGKGYIDDNFTMPLTIEEIAREVALSEYHFLRLFKLVYSISPYQYIIQKRLQYAKSLLNGERPSVSGVALMTGFSDVHSFSKAFKKYFGYSPSSVRS